MHPNYGFVESFDPNHYDLDFSASASILTSFFLHFCVKVSDILLQTMQHFGWDD